MNIEKMMSLISRSSQDRRCSEKMVRRQLLTMSDKIREVFNCSTVAYTGSLSLWLVGERGPGWHDYDVMTDRLLKYGNLPWAPTKMLGHSWLFSSDLGELDIYFRDFPEIHKWREWSLSKLVELPDGLMVFDTQWLKRLCYCMDLVSIKSKYRILERPTYEEFKEVAPLLCSTSCELFYDDMEKRFLKAN